MNQNIFNFCIHKIVAFQTEGTRTSVRNFGVLVERMTANNQIVDEQHIETLKGSVSAENVTINNFFLEDGVRFGQLVKEGDALFSNRTHKSVGNSIRRYKEDPPAIKRLMQHYFFPKKTLKSSATNEMLAIMNNNMKIGMRLFFNREKDRDYGKSFIRFKALFFDASNSEKTPVVSFYLTQSLIMLGRICHHIKDYSTAVENFKYAERQIDPQNFTSSGHLLEIRRCWMNALKASENSESPVPKSGLEVNEQGIIEIARRCEYPFQELRTSTLFCLISLGAYENSLSDLKKSVEELQTDFYKQINIKDVKEKRAKIFSLKEVIEVISKTFTKIGRLLLENDKKPKEALVALNNAEEILKRFTEENNPLRFTVYIRLAQCYSMLSDSAGMRCYLDILENVDDLKTLVPNALYLIFESLRALELQQATLSMVPEEEIGEVGLEDTSSKQGVSSDNYS